MNDARADKIQGPMRPHQYAALRAWAAEFDGGWILEIGCYHGRSSLEMALGAPRAQIVTMSPDAEHVQTARRNVAGYQIEVLQARSWDYLKQDGRVWDMVYVDGDHRHAERDAPWFNRLRTGGLIVFHDYTPQGTSAPRAHVKVVKVVDELARQLGRAPDVKLIDPDLVGMAGFYRREGETWSLTL
jgi:predicted O-methyltransferase YrrM